MNVTIPAVINNRRGRSYSPRKRDGTERGRSVGRGKRGRSVPPVLNSYPWLTVERAQPNLTELLVWTARRYDHDDDFPA